MGEDEGGVLATDRRDVHINVRHLFSLFSLFNAYSHKCTYVARSRMYVGTLGGC